MVNDCVFIYCKHMCVYAFFASYYVPLNSVCRCELSLTGFLHDLFVKHHYVIQNSSHDALCHIMSAVFVDEARVSAKVVLLRQLHERLQQVLVQHQISALQLELRRFHRRDQPNKLHFLWGGKRVREKERANMFLL